MAAAMRVLMTVDAVGGVWTYAAELAAALLPLGIAPTLVLTGPAPSAAQRGELARDVPLIEAGLPLDWLADGPEPVLAAGATLAGLAHDGGYDLVHLNMPSLAAGGAFAMPTVAAMHGCLATWWDAAGEGPLPDAYRWQRGLLAEGLRVASAVVAPSGAFAGEVAAQYRLDAEPLAINNGRHPLVADPAAAPETRLFTVGRLWDRAKGMALLDRVAARLAVPFDAAGAVDGPNGETFLGPHLRLAGTIDRAALAARLAWRPIFVSAARFEPFGLAVLEAAQAGCPLVLADIPSFRELWGPAALFVDPADEDGFVAAIGRLLADAALRDAMGKAALRRAERYTPAATAEAMAALYARLLRQARRAAA